MTASGKAALQNTRFPWASPRHNHAGPHSRVRLAGGWPLGPSWWPDIKNALDAKNMTEKAHTWNFRCHSRSFGHFSTPLLLQRNKILHSDHRMSPKIGYKIFISEVLKHMKKHHSPNDLQFTMTEQEGLDTFKIMIFATPIVYPTEAATSGVNQCHEMSSNVMRCTPTQEGSHS